VHAWKTLNRPNWFILQDAQAMTVVMLEVISTSVFTVPTGTLSHPRGQYPSGEPTRRRI
jgi:hypothetical protein